MKSGWSTAPLMELVERQETVDPTRSPDKRFRYVDVSGVSNQEFRIVEFHELLGREAPSRARRRIRAGDVIFATVRPTLRRIAIVPTELDDEVCSTGYVVLRPRPNLDNRWLFFCLFSPIFAEAMSALQRGASYPAVSDDDVRRQPIPVPPLAEQRRIVAILNETFEGITTATANAEKCLENSQELLRGFVRSKLLYGGYSLRRLNDVCVVDWGNTDLTKRAYVENGTALAVSATGCDGRIAHAEHEAGVPVLSAIGARCGRMFYPGEPFTAIKNTITLTPRKGESEGKFLYYLLQNLDLPKRGAAQPFISKGDIKNFCAPIPKLEEQRVIVEMIDEMARDCAELEKSVRCKLALLAELKQSILHHSFNGDLGPVEALAA